MPRLWTRFAAPAGWRGSSRHSSRRTPSRGRSPTQGPGRTWSRCRAAGTRTWPRCWRLADRIADAFASHGRSAALMPYLMAGFPDLATSRAVGEACIDSGAYLLELGVPFSDPLAVGPVIHADAIQALKAGSTLHGVLRVCESLADRVPVGLTVYANVVLA